MKVESMQLTSFEKGVHCIMYDIMVKELLNRCNVFLNRYLYAEGDLQETIVQKKIWWILTVGGLPFLIVMSLMIADRKGMTVAVINLIFGIGMLGSLVVFHFHKRHIERFALFIQLLIITLTTLKVYLMGGLLEAGGAIFIGLTAPLYALTTRNDKRAVALYIVYLAGMILVTELQPDTVHNYFLYYYYSGFGLGVTIAFAGLYFYTNQLEQMKQKEKLRMQELDRLKSNFYTHITHELRTPLTIILGMADQISREPDKFTKEGLDMIRRNGKKLLHMTNQLLDLSKMEAMLMPVHWVQQDITGYLKYLVESFHSFAEARQIELVVTIEQDRLIMDFDPDKISEILTNLVSNAIKFTPEGGRVEVRAFRKMKNGCDYLQLEVIDNGSGISREHLPKVFERYFQAERHVNEYTEGTGLGLAITRELVRLMKGEISVTSEADHGTVFKVILPITRRAEKSSAVIPENNEALESEAEIPGARSLSLSNPGKLKLLIVEDSKDVARYLHALLSPKYDLLLAADGAEGLKMAIEAVPDLILSDVMMPLMDGFTLCRKLKKDIRTSHIPIILLTARNETLSRMEGLKSGADVYLGKPFNKEELFIQVERLIALRKELKDSLERIGAYPESKQGSISADSTMKTSAEREYGFLTRVRQIVESHLKEEDFGIAALCLELGMSRSQLYRKFSALTDKGVHLFIKNLRLKKAHDLLCSTDLNVSEVAYDTGFKNVSHFSRVYSERFGTPPSQEKKHVEV